MRADSGKDGHQGKGLRSLNSRGTWVAMEFGDQVCFLSLPSQMLISYLLDHSYPLRVRGQFSGDLVQVLVLFLVSSVCVGMPGLCEALKFIQLNPCSL